jgi:FAD/FMN-containing dehydrogenase
LFPKSILKDPSESESWKKSSFWSMHQRTVTPAVVLQPRSAKEVAVALILCKEAECKFAVKSGGHAAMEGASSADGGVTIDLKHLNRVELNEDKTIASLGAGNTWERVFEELAKDGLAVAGGRAGDVGVGGYTLGAFPSSHLRRAGAATMFETLNL